MLNSSNNFEVLTEMYEGLTSQIKGQSLAANNFGSAVAQNRHSGPAASVTSSYQG